MPWTLAPDDGDVLHRQAHSNCRMLGINSSLNLRDGIRRGVLANDGITFWVITATGAIEDMPRIDAQALVQTAIVGNRIGRG